MSKSLDIRTRAAVIVRDSGKCFRCGRQVAICDGEEYKGLPVIHRVGQFSIHHRYPRGMGGSSNPEINSTANLMVLCGTGTTGCHGWVEAHRGQAREDGLLLHGIELPGTNPAFSEYRNSWVDMSTGRLIDVHPETLTDEWQKQHRDYNEWSRKYGD